MARLESATPEWRNGMLTDSIPATEWLFDHGVILGVPIGPPMPAGGASGSSGVTAIARGLPDPMNADASVITQEFPASSSGASVGTRASASGGITYLPGVEYNRPLSDANAP